MRQFERWLQEAIRAALPEPTAMTLATVDADGRPAARIVLLKGVDADGFVFFTNYESRKGQDLALHPDAALLFHWIELERQVRIEGAVEQGRTARESDAYFASRPRSSRLGAWASPQSRTIPDRGWLEREFEAAQRALQATTRAVPRPPHWGGYRVVPSTGRILAGAPLAPARPHRLSTRGRAGGSSGSRRDRAGTAQPLQLSGADRARRSSITRC